MPAGDITPRDGPLAVLRLGRPFSLIAMKSSSWPGAAGVEGCRRERRYLGSALRAARVLTPFGGRDVEEFEFRGVEDGRRAVEALEGRRCDGVGRVDPGRAMVAVAFLEQ